jgi:hypothetical protein
MSKQFNIEFNIAISVPPAIEEMEKGVRRFFERLTPEQRERWKRGYETKLAIIAGTYVPPINPVTKKQKPYHEKFEWMKGPWQEGLRILNEVIEQESKQ